MSSIRYTSDHEWVRAEHDDTLTIGITAYAQAELGDIVYVELPAVGRRCARGEEVCVIESVKTAAEVKLPVAGIVVAVNARLADEPALVNSDPLGAGWFLRIEPTEPAEFATLLDPSVYAALIGS